MFSLKPIIISPFSKANVDALVSSGSVLNTKSYERPGVFSTHVKAKALAAAGSELSNVTPVAPFSGPGVVTAIGAVVSEQAAVVKLNIVPVDEPAQFEVSTDQ